MVSITVCLFYNSSFKLKIVVGQTDIIRTIKDPEKPATLEDLNVVYENGVEVGIQNNYRLMVDLNYILINWPSRL